MLDQVNRIVLQNWGYEVSYTQKNVFSTFFFLNLKFNKGTENKVRGTKHGVTPYCGGRESFHGMLFEQRGLYLPFSTTLLLLLLPDKNLTTLSLT